MESKIQTTNKRTTDRTNERTNDDAATQHGSWVVRALVDGGDARKRITLPTRGAPRGISEQQLAFIERNKGSPRTSTKQAIVDRIGGIWREKRSKPRTKKHRAHTHAEMTSNSTLIECECRESNPSTCKKKVTCEGRFFALIFVLAATACTTRKYVECPAHFLARRGCVATGRDCTVHCVGVQPCA